MEGNNGRSSRENITRERIKNKVERAQYPETLRTLTKEIASDGRVAYEEVIAIIWDLIEEEELSYDAHGYVKKPYPGDDPFSPRTDRLDVVLEKEAGEKRNYRLGRGVPRTLNDPRRPARHDRDRIYYSSAFRRLAAVTQVLTPDPEGFLMHNRLTHSLKVSQVARTIVELLFEREGEHQTVKELGGIDADVVEAAALAHDLGHPPFGHVGEKVMDHYARTILNLEEGFEGNPQTFRILTRLDPRSKPRHREAIGLDLTSATRAAVLKYPWLRDLNFNPPEGPMRLEFDAPWQWRKFGAYRADEAAFWDARSIVPNADNGAQSLEAAIMDVADDITYALHDLEDFHDARVLEISRARHALERWKAVYEHTQVYGRSEEKIEERGATDVVSIFESLRRRLSTDYPDQFDEASYGVAVDVVEGHLFSLGNFTESIGSRRSAATKRVFISTLIKEYIGGISINSSPTVTVPPLLLDKHHWHQIQILKEITRHFVIKRPNMAVIQRGQQLLLVELINSLHDWCSEDRQRLPGSLGEGLELWGERAIIDYIAGLTDHQAIALHRKLTGMDSSLAGIYHIL